MTNKPLSLFNMNTFSKDFDRVFVGLSDYVNNSVTSMYKQIQNNYPPCNIYKVDSHKYVIEMAVAGFGKSDISIEVKDDKLKITGNMNSDSNEAISKLFQYKGIAERNFNRYFIIGDTIEVKNATLVNGMLRLVLEQVASNKEYRVEIEDEPSTVSKYAGGNANPILLNESEV